MQPIKEHSPSRLQHLNQNVIVNVAHKVCHFVVSQIEAVEFSLKVSRESPELLLIRHSEAPRQGERVLDFLELEHEAEDLVVVRHDLLCEDRAKWRQI